MSPVPSPAFVVPDALVASYGAPDDARGRAWLAALPGQAADLLDRWGLRRDGPAGSGMAGLVLPVVRADGTPAVLKLQPPSAENSGVAAGLRAWDGDGVVRLLDSDPVAGAQLLERLDAGRPLSAEPDGTVAVGVLAGLMARLSAVPAPQGMRRLADIAEAMTEQAPEALLLLGDPAERELVRTCAAAVAELAGEAGDRLLHWDLHDGNVLAGEREPWLAIDPEPLAGDPGFELWPALDIRWENVVAGGVTGPVLYRFDLLTEVLGLDRRRAAGWTLGRVLQNALWDIEDGRTALEPAQVALAATLLEHRS
ncbi:streptomycin 6-kinase [Streptomyces sp. ScaeMP-e48]|uniref:aminoglycoside phosphotransferase family protein n=1 Tax=Streptomyces sp. ScaeMP-e48 TaxID=1100823 RepID=UPI000823C785|nr:aminoglycoside phosphotransferase family protein [Streptomyces sp. ScaeMP-e48]SCK33774.1 streptomycin 6-kinase [Streptomyces sp. ScaeMP-e48]